MDTVVQEGTLLAGRYSLGAVLGRGGMADVYDGVDQRLNRPVAVKVLRPEMAVNADVRRRFESEARAAARLAHPNVVSVFDTGEDEGRPFIVMERLPGETLADRMAAGPADQAWIKAVAGDVLQALEAAHRAGIVHRDVKPGNVLLDPEGCAKVADFGIAKSMEPLGPDGDATAVNLLLGTPAYLAPERFEGKPATPQSDLYALGVVLYEALAGRKPFPATTPLAVAKAVQDGAVAPLESVRTDVEPTFAAVVQRAMAAQPEDRYASAAEMRAELEGDATVVAAAPWLVGAGDGAGAGVEATRMMPAALAGAAVAGGGVASGAAAPGADGVTVVERRGWNDLFGHRLFVPVALAALLLLGLVVVVATMSGPASHTAPTTTTTVAPPASVTTVAPPPATPTTVPPAPKPAPKPKGHEKKD